MKRTAEEWRAIAREHAPPPPLSDQQRRELTKIAIGYGLRKAAEMAVTETIAA